ncbi:MAG: glucose-6-phosphate isomerase [Bacteroidales bacterium]|nr:glucose-6-phosphate isomerase [Bacteroidales bacterium]MCF8458747.1 glucose-6-phosphate isomerase [Bacteroidales bacterium]
MATIQIDLSGMKGFFKAEDFEKFKKDSPVQQRKLQNKTGKGNDFLGWLDLPSKISSDEIDQINQLTASVKNKVDFVVVIGIGGSYLGAKAIIEGLSDSFSAFREKGTHPKILFAGQNIGEDYHYELLDFLKDKNYAVVVISKSGTTTEPALAFRLLKSDLENRYSESEVRNRIVAITDSSKGALRTLADQKGYQTFIIPDDVGGRFSVLTPVGLLPIALAGFNIEKLIEGAKDMEQTTSTETFENNVAAQYAVARNVLYAEGKTNEILVNYNPKLHFLAEWWKQLYGESEGKEHKGIFPASVDFSTDLHSMGQYIQDGKRNLFETVISVDKARNELRIPSDPEDLDKLNFIAGKRIDEVNKMAELGTRLAHIDGGVPNIRITIPEISEYTLGQLIYFFEKACAISGYMLDVNPFDQPGVEDYKRNMFALLGKAGYEAETEKLRDRLQGE